MPVLLLVMQDDLPKHLGDVHTKCNVVTSEMDEDIGQSRIQVGTCQQTLIRETPVDEWAEASKTARSLVVVEASLITPCTGK